MNNLYQQKATEALQKMLFPTQKWEAWKYTSVLKWKERSYETKGEVRSTQLSICCIPNSDAHTYVFVNGQFHSACENSQQPKRMIVKLLAELTEEEMEIAEKYFATLVSEDRDIFSAQNLSTNCEGMFIYVPKNEVVETPIHIQHLSDSDLDQSFTHRNLVIVEKNASVKIIETQHGTSKNDSLRNAVSEIFVGENAQLEYVKVQNEGDKASHVETSIVSQGKNSKVYFYTLSFSGDIVRNNLLFHLEGQNVEANLFGTYLLSGSQHIDNHTEVHHKFPHGYSNELYKGIMTDTATGVFNGKIHVYQDAQKTNAYQSNKNILLSDTANLYTKPQLEIYADDVKCSHGATTGQMNEEALFYLRARGIPEKAAKQLMTQAFATEVIEGITMPFVKEYLTELIQNRF
ncbi:MAG: Fe-S cluster assembly protein SufD [Bacteroidia bacterium]